MYDNGGGQMGERENPALSMYHKTLRSYLNAIRALDNIREPDDESVLSILE